MEIIALEYLNNADITTVLVFHGNSIIPSGNYLGSTKLLRKVMLVVINRIHRWESKVGP